MGDVGYELDRYEHPKLYPEQWAHMHHHSKVTNGNAFQVDTQKEQVHNIKTYQETPADGDVFEAKVVLAKGTYTFRVCGITQVDAGIIDWTLDGVSIAAGQDWYGILAYNTVKTTTTITVAKSGIHTLVGTVNGKNGSSSDFYIVLCEYRFEKE